MDGAICSLSAGHLISGCLPFLDTQLSQMHCLDLGASGAAPGTQCPMGE
jgi:hypothetical protein